MKPIIVDMKDMSESTEVYETRPNPFLIYTIYVITALLGVAVLWMVLFKMEIVIKGNGMFRCNEPIYEIGNAVTGKIESCNVKNGQLVEEGDVLFTVDVESLGETIQNYQKNLIDIEERIEVLNAYSGNIEAEGAFPIEMSRNKYYQEFADRKQLLLANMNANTQNTKGQTDSYQGSMDNISTSIDQYKQKKDKLAKTKQCVLDRTNSFDGSDSYHSSIVESYISSYKLTASQYDAQIGEYQRQIEAYDKELKKDKTISENTVNRRQLSAERDALTAKKEGAENEKGQALDNLQLQQISTIEQQIESIDNTLLSLDSSYTSSKLQLDAVKSSNTESMREVQLLSEKGNVAAELLTYGEKKEECENYLKSYDIQDNNCRILANTSGYIYLEQDLREGTFLQEGMNLGKVYPKETTDYYAEIYVENSDIARLKEGQEVKLEIPSYPSSEYGYFTGNIDTISKDISVDEATGSAYYIVHIKCSSLTVQNKNGEVGNIRNGMSCQAKIVVDEERILTYLLRKLDMFD